MATTVLVLADGTTWVGTRCGAQAPTVAKLEASLAAPEGSRRLRDIGEVVFNTAMSGYTEVLTDPSYTGQIVAMTYPHIGNYGVDPTWSETGPEEGSTSPPRTIKIAGFVMRDLYRGPVPGGRITLDRYLAEAGIPGVSGIDTRALTLRLRDGGSANGVLCSPSVGSALSAAETARAKEVAAAFPSMEGRGLITEVGSRRPVHMRGTGGPHLALYDCGTKANIVRELQALGCELTLFPSEATAKEITAAHPDAVMISNGPGDPAVLAHQVQQTRELIGNLPVLGICLGHQIIAEATGARTGKMKFGHHGVNHPVRDERSGRVFVTSQNHGFTVDESTLPAGMQVWFRNANDGSIEGLRDDSRGIRTTQFHPESAPGPVDSRWIFTAFLEGVGTSGARSQE